MTVVATRTGGCRISRQPADTEKEPISDALSLQHWTRKSFDSLSRMKKALPHWTACCSSSMPRELRMRVCSPASKRRASGRLDTTAEVMVARRDRPALPASGKQSFTAGTEFGEGAELGMRGGSEKSLQSSLTGRACTHYSRVANGE